MKKPITLLVLVFCLNTRAQVITTIVGNGTAGFSGDGGQATAAQLNWPDAIAIDALGNIYITEENNNRIRKVNTAGIISTFAGNGTVGYSGDGGQATAAQFHYPTGIAIDAAGNVYIADPDNSCIRKVNTAGIISTFAGNGTAGYSGNGGPATAAKLNMPNAITVDATGNVYITDEYSYHVRKVNTTGIITNVAGNGGTGSFSGDGGPANSAALYFPCALAVNATGLYISDQANYRIREVNTAGVINTFVGNGIESFSGDGGPASAAEINDPYGITLDAAGNLYISDQYNFRIRMVNTAGIINTIVGSGTQGYSGDGGSAIAAELNNPVGICLDAAGNLYIVDNGNNVVRKVTKAGKESIQQFATNKEQVSVYPNPNNGSFVIESQNTLYNVLCTVYDVSGKLVLAQTINGRTTIDAGSLNEGVYNISLQSNEGVVNKRLVIVK